MASTGQKWAIGCGIGCLLTIAILGGVGTCSYVGIKRIADRADELEVSLDELKARFGPPEDFVPAADGAMDDTTIEVFLAAREDLLGRTVDLVEILETLGSDAKTIAKFRAAMKIVPSALEFVGQRGAVLLEHDLHPGQYIYLYAVAYYSWLGHDPGDGPDFDLDGDDENGGFRWQAGEHKPDVHRDRARRARRALNELMISWLGNQQEALAATGAADPQWSAALARELDALRLDPERLAWEDGLPPALEMSLAPYREAFENTYAEQINAMEIALLDDD